MKIVIYICFLCCFLAGCEEKKPPVNLGYGTMYMFYTNGMSDKDKAFHNDLNKFLSEHREFKVKSITEIENNKFLVVMDRILPEIIQ